MTLLETLDQAKHSLFRFESLQEYIVNSEKDLVQTWKSEHRIADEHMQEWWDYVSSKKAAGITMQRVSLLRYPLTSYKEMELEIFKKTNKYGDDIRIINGDDFDNLSVGAQDFWLIDDTFAVILNYEANGEWIGFDTTNEVSKYLKIKDLILSKSKHF